MGVYRVCWFEDIGESNAKKMEHEMDTGIT